MKAVICGELAWVVILLVGVFAARAAVEPVSLLPAAVAEIETLVRAEMNQRHIPGLAVTVIRDGQTVWTGYYGLADLENELPVNAQTVFRFASVTKALTAVAALRLVQAGRIALDAPVTTILGSGDGVPDSLITVRHLLSHQSGLRHYQPRASREPLTHYNRLSEVLRAKAADPLLFLPGTRLSYTTHGYVLLGRVIEVASGEEFAEHMRTTVFAVAGMKTARVDDWYVIIPHRTRGYFRSLNGDLRNAEPDDLSAKIPGGGLCGTIGDLGAFAGALQRHTLLSRDITELMGTPQALADGSVTPYCLGWSVGGAKGRREIYHPGGQPGASSLLWLATDDGVAVAILANLEQVNFLPLARKLRGIAHKKAPHR